LGEVLEHFVDEFRSKLRLILSEVHDTVSDLRHKWCEQASAKKQLRIKTRQELCVSGSDYGLRVNKVKYKCKPGELLAYFKYLRAVGDLTCPGSTVLGYYMDFVKLAFSQPYDFDGCRSTFVKSPQHHLLIQAFRNLLNPQTLEFIYFSDDSCVSIRCLDNTVHVFNMDISACDGSNYDPIFLILRKMMNVDPRFKKDIYNAFSQLSLPCDIRSTNGYDKVVLIPLFMSLYSGSTLTTATNNTANSMIFLCIKHMITTNGIPRNRTEAERYIVSSASRAGFNVKLDHCDCPEDIQFLKISPTYVRGNLSIFVNIGTLLRGMGHTKFDVAGGKKIPLSTRCRRHTSGVIRSYVHAGKHKLWAALQHLIISGDNYTSNDQEFWRNIDSSDYIPDESILRRYKLLPHQWDDLVVQAKNCDIHDAIHCEALDIIYAKDYGY
jgi:hypothetical protein